MNAAPYALCGLALAISIVLTIRGVQIRREERASPGAVAEIRFQFLAEEDPNTRAGLGRALAILEGSGKDDPLTDYSDLLGQIARYAFATGDDRSAMLEAFAAACDHQVFAAEIEAAVWATLERMRGEGCRRDKEREIPTRRGLL